MQLCPVPHTPMPYHSPLPTEHWVQFENTHHIQYTRSDCATYFLVSQQWAVAAQYCNTNYSLFTDAGERFMAWPNFEVKVQRGCTLRSIKTLTHQCSLYLLSSVETISQVKGFVTIVLSWLRWVSDKRGMPVKGCALSHIMLLDWQRLFLKQYMFLRLKYFIHGLYKIKKHMWITLL